MTNDECEDFLRKYPQWGAAARAEPGGAEVQAKTRLKEIRRVEKKWEPGWLCRDKYPDNTTE